MVKIAIHMYFLLVKIAILMVESLCFLLKKKHHELMLQETIHGHLKMASKLADPGYARAALLANADPRAHQAFGVGKRPAPS